MAYENEKLVVAGLSGQIYLTKVLKSGTMSDTRKIVTEDCLAATTEWFMANKKSVISYHSKDATKTPHLFFTDDLEKASKIKTILLE